MIDVSHTLKLIRARGEPRVSQSIGYPSADDVIERAAFLEYCEGLDRASADQQALHEFGFNSWDAVSSPAAHDPVPTCVPHHPETHAQGAH